MINHIKWNRKYIFRTKYSQDGYIVQKDESSGGILQQGMNEQQNMEKNNSEIQFVMNPRDL